VILEFNFLDASITLYLWVLNTLQKN